MEKLNKWQTIVAEIQEARRAGDKADVQRLQSDRRLYFVPNIVRVVLAVAFIMLLLLVAFWYGSEQVESEVIEIVKIKKAEPIVLPCLSGSLPETGADVN